jgi:hypothetical protein
MSTLTYNVLVRHEVNQVGLSYYLASIPDLNCQAIGASSSEAVEAVRRQALLKLKELEGSTRTPPKPSQLSLTAVELPVPQPRAMAR